ncbi:MAG: hypothetical protein PHX01_00260 [Clostridia bacterium]|nr:hypothetical protein [Clostridia bacterium]
MRTSSVIVVCILGLLFIFTFLSSTCSSRLRIAQKNTKFGKKSVWISSLRERLCYGLFCASKHGIELKHVVVIFKDEEMLQLVINKLSQVNSFAEFKEVSKDPELTTLGYFFPQEKNVKVRIRNKYWVRIIRNKYWVRIKGERYICKMIKEEQIGTIFLPENMFIA